MSKSQKIVSKEHHTRLECGLTLPKYLLLIEMQGMLEEVRG